MSVHLCLPVLIFYLLFVLVGLLYHYSEMLGSLVIAPFRLSCRTIAHVWNIINYLVKNLMVVKNMCVPIRWIQMF